MVGFCLWGSVPDPHTLYKAIRQVPAGHSLWIDRRTGPQTPQRFLSVAQTLSGGGADPMREPASLVRAALQDSVAAHLLADVDVGLFLSAGVDSGALLGLMREAGQSRTRTITLRFAEFVDTQEDESILAAHAARHYGAEHAVRTVSEAEFRNDMPAILAAMDQPSIDGVNTWFVAKAAKEHGLKVALSGVGGDEMFAGYPSFVEIPRWVGMFGWAQAAPGLGAGARVLGDALGFSRGNPKATALLEYGGRFGDAYVLRRALWLPHQLGDLLTAREIADGLAEVRPQRACAGVLDEINPTGRADPLVKVAALESVLYMRNQLLRDTDWAGMAHSLEVRTPFVDTVLAAQLAPVIPQFGQGRGKAWLGQSPQRALPPEIAERPKTGFGVPTGQWLAKAAGGMTKGIASRLWGRRVLADPAFA
jgi:asparagine synthase (glutamine-hydrolysing)